MGFVDSGMGWTVEQALSLAPDAASASAGRGLASATKWQSAGRDDALAWGEAKGSGAKPYQTVVNLGDGASKCSCPSRKFPCKHALGLLLRVAAGEVAAGEPTDWARDWAEKRGQKAAAKVEKAEATPKAADPRTAEKRWANVLRGLDECEAFLRDAVGNGLLLTGATRSWDDMAKRMVDAQAPGVARRLRRIGETVGVGAEGGERAAAGIGSLALLVRAARRVEALGDLAHDVRAALGVPGGDEGAEERVRDVWDVVGTFGHEEDRLWTRRTWFLGRASGRWALHLGFAPGANPPPPLAPYGAALDAEAVFAPSAWPLRAEIEGGEGRPFAPRRGGTWAQAFEAQADALAQNPWLDLFPVLLTDAAFGKVEGRWRVIDAAGAGVPFVGADDEREWLLGRTGNQPCEIFGEFDGRGLRVVSYREREG